VTGRLFRAKKAPRPLFAPPHSYIERVDFVYRVFSVMSIAFGEIATKLGKEGVNETAYRSGCRPQSDATPAPHAQANNFCHEIPRLAIRQNVYFRNAVHGILESVAGSASVRYRCFTGSKGISGTLRQLLGCPRVKMNGPQVADDGLPHLVLSHKVLTLEQGFPAHT